MKRIIKPFDAEKKASKEEKLKEMMLSVLASKVNSKDSSPKKELK